jgi:hypothetical protein
MLIYIAIIINLIMYVKKKFIIERLRGIRPLEGGAADKAAIQLVKVQPYQLPVSDT